MSGACFVTAVSRHPRAKSGRAETALNLSTASLKFGRSRNKEVVNEISLPVKFTGPTIAKHWAASSRLHRESNAGHVNE